MRSVIILPMLLFLVLLLLYACNNDTVYNEYYCDEPSCVDLPNTKEASYVKWINDDVVEYWYLLKKWENCSLYSVDTYTRDDDCWVLSNVRNVYIFEEVKYKIQKKGKKDDDKGRDTRKDRELD